MRRCCTVSLFVAALITGPAVPQVLPPDDDAQAHATALLLEAESHLTGAAGRIDEARARLLLDQAVALGDSVARLRRLTLARLGRPGFELAPADAEQLGSSFAVAFERAREGDPAAQTVIGTAYLIGAAVERDPAEAASWYRKTAGQYPWAAHNLGWMYHSGTGVPQDDGQAFRWYNLEARSGTLSSIYELGVARILGRGTEKRLAEGLRHLERAAQGGDHNAMEYLGTLLLFGKEGVAPEPAEGLRWLEAAAAAGDASAMFYVGVAYAEGNGLAADDSKAFSWLAKGAAAGHAEAANYVGLMYWKGRGTGRDLDQALHWLVEAVLSGEDDHAPDNLLTIDMDEEVEGALAKRVLAELEAAVREGNPFAQGVLSLFIAAGHFGATWDAERSFELASTGARGGSGRAMHMLANSYWEGRGTPVDRRQAIEWFHRAAEAGNKLAAYQLGLRYLEGEGVPKDLGAGIRWIERAAGERLWAAELQLARTYEHGYYGVSPDRQRARNWYERAAADGVEEAIGWLKVEDALDAQE